MTERKEQTVHDIYALAKQVESLGRGGDTVLVHMTPGEVGSLQTLAAAHGGSLTINPNTGLVEANFLKTILPIALGGLLTLIPGLGPLAAAGMVGAGTTAATGNIKDGLMAALGAFGGAGIAGGIAGLGGAVGSAGTAGAAGATGAATGAAGATGAATGAAGATGAATGAAGATGAGAGLSPALQAAVANPFTIAAQTPALPTLKTGLAGAMQGFTNTTGGAAQALGLPRAAGVGLGALGVANPLLQPQTAKDMEEETQSNYAGPYSPQTRTPQFIGSPLVDAGERQYFDNVNPFGEAVPYNNSYNIAPYTPPPGGYVVPGSEPKKKNRSMFAAGGVTLKDGGFVMDARTVSELGNGSSSAGQERLAPMGGKPVKGAGDGVSDSVPANIDGVTPARVARDEVVFPPNAVRKLGKGDHKRGASRLYDIMAKAETARRSTGRGESNGLRGVSAR